MDKEINLRAVLTKLPNNNYRVGVEPPHNWQKLAYFMEVVGVLAHGFVGNNPKDINSDEEMAEYISEYITKVIMSAK